MSSRSSTIWRPHAPPLPEPRRAALVCGPGAGRALRVDLQETDPVVDGALAGAGRLVLLSGPEALPGTLSAADLIRRWAGVPVVIEHAAGPDRLPAFEDTLSAGASLALRLVAIRRPADVGELAAEAEALAALPSLLSRVRARHGRVAHVAANIARAFDERFRFALVAGGESAGAALHGARALRRCAGIDAEIVEPGTRSSAPHLESVVVGLLTPSPAFARVAAELADLRRRGHAAVVITDETAAPRAALHADWLLVLPASVPALAPALAAASLDVLARQLAGVHAAPFPIAHERCP